MTMSLSKPLYAYPNPHGQVFTTLFKRDVSDTLVVQVKLQDCSGKKFFDIRRTNERTGKFSPSGIFMTKEELPTFEEALNNIPSPGTGARSYTFTTGRTMEVLATADFVQISATRERSQRGPASINITYDELSKIIPSLTIAKQCL